MLTRSMRTGTTREPLPHGTPTEPTPVPELKGGPILLCDAHGRLRPEAIGWSRTPLHVCNLHGHRGRKKRWHHWAVTSDDVFFTVTLADLDYVGFAAVYLLELSSRREFEAGMLVPLGLGCVWPETVDGDVDVRVPMIRAHLRDDAEGTQLSVHARALSGKVLEAELFATLPPRHETLSVVVPWSGDRFQYTSKHNTRPVTGTLRVGHSALHFGPRNQAFGCLDFGRGVWPRATRWNWGAASGIVCGRPFGINLGGQWTDRTGANENGLCVDGVLDKLPSDVDFNHRGPRHWLPWTVRSRSDDRVALSVLPALHKHLSVRLGVASVRLELVIGHYEGELALGSGERLVVPPLLGWAEELVARW